MRKHAIFIVERCTGSGASYWPIRTGYPILAIHFEFSIDK